MIFDLLIKIYCTPENIIALILNICAIIAMCFIFKSFGEKWWKSLVPLYSNFILYKHTWLFGWYFLIEFFFDLAYAKSISMIKKHIIFNVFETIKYYLEYEKLNVDINVMLIISCLICFLITYVIIFILKRVTYWKLCNKLNVNLLLKIGTMIIPDIFLLIDIIYHNKKQKIKIT